MSRTHERAYHLLAERVRLGTPARRALYVTIAALVLSGVWWIGVHFAGAWLATREDELQRLAQESLALKIHGAAAFAILLALGAMGAYHVRRGWGLGRNRGSGSVVVFVLAVLIVSPATRCITWSPMRAARRFRSCTGDSGWDWCRC